jgi:hypothetical protein
LMSSSPFANLAMAAYCAGAAGVLLRARWGSIALAVSALAAGQVIAASIPSRTHVVGVFYLALLGLAAAALLAAAWLSSRTARSGAGTLRGLAA